jgi:hypothetical protein
MANGKWHIANGMVEMANGTSKCTDVFGVQPTTT